MARARRYFGSVRKLPSGRFQARYRGPDGRSYTARTADGTALTFDSRQYADAYLARVHADIQAGRWAAPDAGPKVEPVTLADYAAAWMSGRELSPSTRQLYGILLRRQILPGLGAHPVEAITPAMVRAWHSGLDPSKPAQRTHAYSLLRSILSTAVADEVIPVNPCKVRGAGSVKRARTPRPASVPELEALTAALPSRYRLMALLAAWCALRFGELAELRRPDVDVKRGVLHVRRSVVRGEGGRVVKAPKSEAGKRDVTIPPHLIPAVVEHLRRHVAARRDALLFPAAHGGHMAPSTLYAVFQPARDAAGRPDLRFHDLRHTGATLAAVSGATLRELMARLGHSTASAAMIYQHVAQDRDQVIAAALSELAGAATVTPITSAKGANRAG